MDKAALVERIRQSVIGADVAVEGPFGLRRVVYADYTASGRSLAFIEDYIRAAVLPLYANTHTETSGTGHQTTAFREEARRIIRRCVGGTDDHAVIFAGSGSTGAIDRLIGILGLRVPAPLEDRYHLTDLIPANERPVVFVGPFEHHSNELPWRESIAEVVEIREDADGHADLSHLDEELDKYRDRPLRIGSFSAASNVTGIVSDTEALAATLHRQGALAFFDYAAAAPYLQIDMGSSANDGYKDAIFLSPHKFIGGPGTPGVLVVRRSLLHNRVPAIPGGGTVAYVNPVEHRYVSDPEHREEGGTPAIVESIRAGLVFLLKERVGVEEIRRREEALIRRAIHSWGANPNISILGNPNAERLSIVSFVVRHGAKALHHNFVVAVLNDLLGIQARGGCSCAGPYGHRLLGIDLETSHRFEEQVLAGCEGIKPGWVRVNFNYFISEEEFSYLVDGVHLVADQGWKLLPAYHFDPAEGTWWHRAGRGEPLSLEETAFRAEPPHPLTAPLGSLAEQLAAAGAVLSGQLRIRGETVALPPAAEALRWFTLPTEVRT